MAEEFITIFSDEHRQLREILLALIAAFEEGDNERALEAIEEMAALAGPHFEYEQEVLYPALAEVHGDERVEKLLEEHGEALEAAQQLAELAEQDALDEEAAAYGAELARQLLPHAGDGDDVAVMVAELEPSRIKKIHKAHKASKKSGTKLASLTRIPVKKVSTKKVSARKPVRKAATKGSAKQSRVSVPKARSRKPSGAAKRKRR